MLPRYGEEAWRLRLRIAGGDWCTPSAWQEPGTSGIELPVPTQPVVTSNAFLFMLQWEVSGPRVQVQSLQFEVQVQARKRRGSSKWSDWVVVCSYSTVPEQAAGSLTTIHAVVERAVVAESVKASFGYEASPSGWV